MRENFGASTGYALRTGSSEWIKAAIPQLTLRMRDPGCGIRDTRFGIRDPGYAIREILHAELQVAPVSLVPPVSLVLGIRDRSSSAHE